MLTKTNAIIFGFIGTLVGAFNPARLLLLPNSWFGTMSNFTLLAIPFFVFLGAVLEKSGLAEELLDFSQIDDLVKYMANIS